METIKNRYDFVFYFDVKDGNPNGDPDAGNLPRIDAETANGLVTDVCIKRKVRNYVQLTKEEKTPYNIFIKERAVLNNLIDEAHEDDEVSKKEKDKDKTESARMWMCKNYYDVRTFGAVMSTGKNAGQVRGPIQITFARSTDPIVALEHSITRVAKTTEARSETGGSEMGRKYTVPYGLYRAHGFISAHLANQTGFNEEDLSLFWEAMQNMFEHDHSAARGMMNTRKLIVFKHQTALGNQLAHELFDRVTHKKLTDGPARDYSDYEILLDGEKFTEIFKVVEVK
ncbi:MAG: type I-C CRISPR-associated protein Cas7/Csd2 [Melioribacteraceae bacterium]|nr:MAG: type I-C CRISPR-associated protein Cas7/Csd2 [Melioribacteraceae bacterium]